ncbi:hypothetical protein KSP40_PGU017991 [Platanthera guangdongensis]|uniref:Uncharacterized protein n=1 Tax=Platanthera guangdongensis TaxID=2320717 RepID=A0ABR2LTG0_9ASPA
MGDLLGIPHDVGLTEELSLIEGRLCQPTPRQWVGKGLGCLGCSPITSRTTKLRRYPVGSLGSSCGLPCAEMSGALPKTGRAHLIAAGAQLITGYISTVAQGMGLSNGGLSPSSKEGGTVEEEKHTIQSTDVNFDAKMKGSGFEKVEISRTESNSPPSKFPSLGSEHLQRIETESERFKKEATAVYAMMIKDYHVNAKRKPPINNHQPSEGEENEKP